VSLALVQLEHLCITVLSHSIVPAVPITCLLAHSWNSFGRTEQLRKLGNFIDYYLDEFNQNESSYATSKELRNSVAVGTTERGLSHPSSYLAWELFNYRVAVLSICQSTSGPV
jgi:hypothetical protein